MLKNDKKRTICLSKWTDMIAGTSIGIISFPLCLAAVQNIVFRPLHITCKSRVLRTVFGSGSVFVCGIIASGATLGCCSLLQRVSSTSEKPAAFEINVEVSPRALCMYGVGSLLVFKFIFGGRSRYVVPSHLYAPGAFAKVGFPAKKNIYASPAMKRRLYLLGRKYGCHSCGKKRQKYFIADHIPPNKLVTSKQTQLFYPQCQRCSNKQGGALVSGKKWQAIQTHGTSLGKYHIWLPIPLIFAVMENIF